MWRASILTIFPEMFPGPLGLSLAGKALAARAEEVKQQLAAGKPTIPTTIGAEKADNPFLRADVADVAQSVGLAGSPAWKVFAEIRERKNRF